MELFWYMAGIVVAACLFAGGLIMGWFWMTGLSLFLIPLVAVWGIVSSGPGSAHNPYHH